MPEDIKTMLIFVMNFRNKFESRDSKLFSPDVSSTAAANILKDFDEVAVEFPPLTAHHPLYLKGSKFLIVSVASVVGMDCGF